MYVCICNAVTDHAIRDAVSNGVHSMRELRFATGCSTQCGSCAVEVKKILDQSLAETDSHSPNSKPFLNVVA